MDVSTTLRKAALLLWPGIGSKVDGQYLFCCTVVTAEGPAPLAGEAIAYLAFLGMPKGLGAFHDIEYGEARQAARYCWLMFAADLWDEGVRP